MGLVRGGGCSVEEGPLFFVLTEASSVDDRILLTDQ